VTTQLQLVVVVVVVVVSVDHVILSRLDRRLFLWFLLVLLRGHPVSVVMFESSGISSTSSRTPQKTTFPL